MPVAAALAAGFLTQGAAPAAAAGDTSLGDVTGFTADGATYTFEAGTAKVRVVFQRDDVFRLWLAPDGTFSDPANSDPSDPSAPDADIVIKNDYAKPATSHVETATGYELRTGAVTLKATKSPLTFSLYRADGSKVWSESSPLSWSDTNATQRLARGANEQFLGGGMQNGRFSHRGQTVKIARNFNWEDGGYPNASPYYMSSAGYGVLRNTFAPGSYAFNEPVATTHDERRFDAYYFVGDFKTSLDRYTELTGRPFLPPIYGLEYGDSDCYNRGHYGEDPVTSNDWKLHPDKKTTLDAVKVAQKFVDEDMPRGWMLVNDDYGCGYSDDLGYEKVGDTYWGKREIEPLKATGDELRKRGIEMGLWTESQLDRQPAEVGTAGVRVRKLDVAWVGPGYRHALTACEDAYDGIEEHSDARGYSWMVEGWAGAQRCSVMWTGDHSGNLSNIKWQIPAIHGSGNSGIAYAAGDVDGIFGGSDVSYVRDMQWKVFNPAFMSMSGWANPAYKQPWSRGGEYTDINRKYLKLRERLLPFFYSYAAEAHRTGAPLNRSLPLEYPNDPNAYGAGATHEFLAGQEFLVAPMWDEGETKNGIYLPEGLWVDYWSGKVYQGPATINGYHAPLDRLPLFTKAGAVVPMFKAGINNHAEHKPGDRLTVDVYPMGNTDFQLYEDDRVTRAHRQSAYATQDFEVTAPTKARGDVVVRIGSSVGSYTGKPSARPYELTVHTGTKPGAVALGDKALPALASKAAYDTASTGWYYDAEDRGGVVYVKTPSVSTSSAATLTLSGTTSVGGGERVDDSFGTVEASVPALFNAPGQGTNATVSFRNGSAAPMKDVNLTVAAPDGWTAGTRTFSKVDPGKTVTATVAVTPGTSVKPASYTLTPKATYTARETRHTATAAATAVIPYGSVAAAYNTVGISDKDSYAKGNLDGAGNSLPAELLAEKGYTPGATVTANGAEFTWPAAAPGTNNTVKGVNHPILVSGTGTHLALLGTGVNTRATGTVTVLYTDGTSSNHSLTFPNWSFQDATTGGSKLAVSVNGRYTPTGLANTDVAYRVFYNTVELKPGKTVKAVKLPSSSTIGVFAATVHDRPLPPAPKGEAYVSDLEFLEATNGWGPVERDRSNGESAGGDGATITLNGTTYAKGLGAHAISNVKVHTGGACTRFTAKVGVDDEMADRGSIQFKVVVDGVTKYTSPVMTGNSATVDVDVDVSGGKYLELYIGDGGNGVGSDHGDWADAKLACAP